MSKSRKPKLHSALSAVTLVGLVGIIVVLLLLTFTHISSRSRVPSGAISYFLQVLNVSFGLEGTSTNDIFQHQYQDQNQLSKIKWENATVLCWVMTSPQNFQTKAVTVNNTWGKRCDKILFMSSVNDTNEGVIALPNTAEGRDWLWAKTKEAFKYIWEHHRDYDWFMKTDDDTYVIVENLRYMLQDYDSSLPIWFGSWLKRKYMSGGAGYVLSKESLRRFVEIALAGSRCWQYFNGDEDVEIGKCLLSVDVKDGDSRDEFGRHRFMPLNPQRHIADGRVGAEISWFLRQSVYPQKEGAECCSETAISFHYVSPGEMQVLEYMLYNVSIFGTRKRNLI